MKTPPRRLIIAAGTLVGLGVAALLRLALHRDDLASFTLLATLIAGGLPLVAATVRGLLRGRFAADVVAALAIVVAALLGEYFAGAIIVLMQAGGEALEAFAMRRASHSLEALLSRAPRIARRHQDGAITDLPVETVAAGDALVLRPGDMVPVDCVVTSGRSSVDQAALTGEPLPIPALPGTELLSGSINLGGSLDVRAIRPAGESQYQQVVRLVEAAQAGNAPIQRLADRYAVWFTPATLLMCGVAWLVDGNAASVLAVLVVATPCPLILATPVAVIAGIGRAARRGIIVRDGAAIEEVGRAHTVVFDKTGTLTLGAPAVDRITAAPGVTPDELLRLAAAVEQRSSHHLGQAIAREARRRSGRLAEVTDFREAPGSGVEGMVEGRHVAVGSSGWLGCAGPPEEGRPLSVAEVCVNGAWAGRIAFADRLRPEAPGLMEGLRRLGVRDLVMLTGDRRPVALEIARAAGIGTVHADLLPAGKVAVMGELRRGRGSVVMVGDGINDAPALAAASVGIAMGAHAPAAAAQAADIVLLVDDVGRVAEAVAIGRRTRAVALQGIAVGLGVSGVLMIVAAFGHITPAFGALLQEGLDVAVILHALRARYGPGGHAMKARSSHLRDPFTRPAAVSPPWPASSLPMIRATDTPPGSATASSTGWRRTSTR